MNSKNLLMAVFLFSYNAYGADITGPVQRTRVDSEGNLWFSMDTAGASAYCAPGWYNMSMFVSKDNPQLPYYFAMVMSAQAKGKSVYIPNVGIFNGTTPCDIGKTGYGIVLMP